MATWLPAFLSGLSAVLVAIIEARAAKERKKEKKNQEDDQKRKAIENGVLALLRDRIIERYNHYSEQKYIPIYGTENVLAMYAAYHALGGNGTITELVEDLKSLPHDLPEE